MAMKQRAGFTLVELMIAMVAGAFVVAGVYYLNGISARTYAQQTSVADAQMSLRSAMEQIRRDVARAGYLAAPYTGSLRNCEGVVSGTGATTTTSHHFQAIAVGPGASTSYAPDVAPNNGTQVAALLGGNPVAADDLTMYGAYASADAFLVDSYQVSNVANPTIPLQINNEAFRRNFFTPAANNGAATANADAFTNTFYAGRMVRIEAGGHFYFRVIQSSSWTSGAPTITLASALPTCLENTMWMAVAPVSRIHYGLESDLNPDLARLRANSTLPGSRRLLLVRREERADSLRPPAASNIPAAGALTAIAGTARAVLDYAVEFGISAVWNSAADTARPIFQYAITPTEIAALNAAPQRYRSLIVTLSSRSAEVDPRLGAVGARRARANNFLGDPLLTFNVIDPNYATLANLQARVRTLRSEIFLQNL